MKLVLVAGLNPRVTKIGPKVRLYEGLWKLITEHQKDCELVLCCNERKEFVANESIFSSNGQSFSVSISKAGTEDFINVFAESINEPIPATTS